MPLEAQTETRSAKALQYARVTLNVAVQVAGLSPFSQVQTALKLGSSIIASLENVNTVKLAFANLAAQVGRTLHFVVDALSGKEYQIGQALAQDLIDLTKVLENIAELIEEQQERSRLTRWIWADDDAGQAKECSQRLDDELKFFALKCQVRTNAGVDDLRNLIESLHDEITHLKSPTGRRPSKSPQTNSPGAHKQGWRKSDAGPWKPKDGSKSTWKQKDLPPRPEKKPWKPPPKPHRKRSKSVDDAAWAKDSGNDDDKNSGSKWTGKPNRNAVGQKISKDGKWEQRDDGAWIPNLADKENKKETKDSKMNNAGKITSKDEKWEQRDDGTRTPNLTNEEDKRNPGKSNSNATGKMISEDGKWEQRDDGTLIPKLADLKPDDLGANGKTTGKNKWQNNSPGQQTIVVKFPSPNTPRNESEKGTDSSIENTAQAEMLSRTMRFAQEALTTAEFRQKSDAKDNRQRANSTGNTGKGKKFENSLGVKGTPRLTLPADDQTLHKSKPELSPSPNPPGKNWEPDQLNPESKKGDWRRPKAISDAGSSK